ncbi:MAG: V-type ATP synthase subunit F [Clostridia bacterium]|nr:V-type ATP synthase subunit F [Clostridia bacterium]
MKCFLVSDNSETLTGFRLAGVEGALCRSPQEVEKAVDAACGDDEVAVLILTQKAAELCREKIERLKLTLDRPVAVEIPDRHGYEGELPITRYIREAVSMG